MASGTGEVLKSPAENRTAHAVGAWKAVFNGKDLTGWHVEDTGRGMQGWSVEQGVVVARGQGFGTCNYLLTDSEYSDFALRLEFCLDKGSGSGLALRALLGDEMPLPTGGRIHDHPLLKLNESPGSEETGTTYWIRDARLHVRPDQSARLKPAGSWNLLEVEVKGRTMRVSINGKPILDTKLDPGALFPDGTGPGLNRIKGRIGLQKHTGTVRFRHIMVKDLSDAPGATASTSAKRRGIPR